MNEVHLAGYVGTQPELRYTGEGTAVANVRLATDESYTNRDGETVEQTEWHSLTFWGRKAEVIEEYVQKGDFLMIDRGKLTTREWEDRDGNTRYSTEIKVLEFSFGPSGEDAPETENQSEPDRQPAGAGSGGSESEEDFQPDDELPF